MLELTAAHGLWPSKIFPRLVSIPCHARPGSCFQCRCRRQCQCLNCLNIMASLIWTGLYKKWTGLKNQSVWIEMFCNAKVRFWQCLLCFAVSCYLHNYNNSYCVAFTSWLLKLRHYLRPWARFVEAKKRTRWENPTRLLKICN